MPPAISEGATEMALICSQILGAAAASFDTQTILGGGSIPRSFNHLQAVVLMRSTSVATNDNVMFRFNNDSGANYDNQFARSANATADAGSAAAQTYGCRCGQPAAANAPSGVFDLATIFIPCYAQTTAQKVVIADWTQKVGTASTNFEVGQWASWWRSTAAITQINVYPFSGANWDVGSAFYLYGIL